MRGQGEGGGGCTSHGRHPCQVQTVAEYQQSLASLDSLAPAKPAEARCWIHSLVHSTVVLSACNCASGCFTHWCAAGRMWVGVADCTFLPTHHCYAFSRCRATASGSLTSINSGSSPVPRFKCCPAGRGWARGWGNSLSPVLLAVTHHLQLFSRCRPTASGSQASSRMRIESCVNCVR